MNGAGKPAPFFFVSETMKEKEAIKKVEDSLGIETVYYFTIQEVRAFVDDGETKPIINDNLEMVMRFAPTLKELVKQVKEWIKMKKAGFIEGGAISENTMNLSFDTPDLSIYATIHGIKGEDEQVEISEEEEQEFLKKLGPKKR